MEQEATTPEISTPQVEAPETQEKDQEGPQEDLDAEASSQETGELTFIERRKADMDAWPGFDASFFEGTPVDRDTFNSKIRALEVETAGNPPHTAAEDYNMIGKHFNTVEELKMLCVVQAMGVRAASHEIEMLRNSTEILRATESIKEKFRNRAQSKQESKTVEFPAQ